MVCQDRLSFRINQLTFAPNGKIQISKSLTPKIRWRRA
jgi:hypothetical protein